MSNSQIARKKARLDDSNDQQEVSSDTDYDEDEDLEIESQTLSNAQSKSVSKGMVCLPPYFSSSLWISANMDCIHSCRKSLKQALYRAWRYSTLCVISISRSSWVQRSTLSLVIMEVCTWYLVIYTKLTYNIIGGKSAILTAITIALGAKANSTNRGKNLSSLIREGAK